MCFVLFCSLFLFSENRSRLYEMVQKSGFQRTMYEMILLYEKLRAGNFKTQAISSMLSNDLRTYNNKCVYYRLLVTCNVPFTC